ncbi:hypothetical protein VaNZ11_001355 [Volvox africanus]|uniref:RBR-type E3 ubiquitin transferase n=1 Tax=Volvox africanus TaxID=51714 RepID=A0ABQ5RPI7_9CHLO|nr:hypothetical protein VaNZ11_001355 [Volvox africanus]
MATTGCSSSCSANSSNALNWRSWRLFKRSAMQTAFIGPVQAGDVRAANGDNTDGSACRAAMEDAEAAAAAAVAADGGLLCIRCFERFLPPGYETGAVRSTASSNSSSSYSCGSISNSNSGRNTTSSICSNNSSSSNSNSSSTSVSYSSARIELAASAGCKHYFCSGCLTEYMRGMVRDRKFPINCPMAAGQQGCKLEFSREAVLVALEGHPKEIQVFEQLEADHVLRVQPHVFCPHPGCSSPLLLPGPGERPLPADKPTTCPACQRTFCPRCAVPGWHKGYSCALFQTLPPEDRNPDTAAVLRLGATRSWQRCPSCRSLVERSGGCNHIRCRCGCQFCYSCSKAYLSSKPSNTNVHGTQGCSCPLWLG